MSKKEEDEAYIVRDWYVGKECDPRYVEDVLKCVETMARLHNVMCMEMEESIHTSNLVEECDRHNRELRKTRKYLQKKKRKNEFEERLQGSISYFIDLGEQTVEGMKREGYQTLLEEHPNQICHGECTQHNFIFWKQGISVINFEHWSCGLQISDLSQFMRKILEKHQWNVSLGRDILRVYQRQKVLSDGEKKNLILLLSYPWKFWKIANFYVNNNKVWISKKNVEKLERTIQQAEQWNLFLKQI